MDGLGRGPRMEAAARPGAGSQVATCRSQQRAPGDRPPLEQGDGCRGPAEHPLASAALSRTPTQGTA